MQANWSLIINILLLLGVLLAIGRVMRSRHPNDLMKNVSSDMAPVDTMAHDDIISVRKINQDLFVNPDEEPLHVDEKPTMKATPSSIRPEKKEKKTTSSDAVMIFLLAKEDRQFAGYDLLQTLLTAGLRYGDGQLFHRHQHLNGQGPVLCSLAAATASGTFDMQNIGAFTARGLCLFMERSNNANIDSERFTIMLDTAKQLSEGLDCHLLNDQRKPLNDEGINRYHRMLED